MPEYTNNILLTGMWPPTNHMLRQFSPNPRQSRWFWKGSNWRGHGFDIYAFFPEFSIPDDEVGYADEWESHEDLDRDDVGVEHIGHFQVDYQDTREDWERITRWLRPCAIITFSRGGFNHNWQIENVLRNRPKSEWARDMKGDERKPTPAPPDTSFPTGDWRLSTLPKEQIIDRVNSAFDRSDVFATKNSGAGKFLSEFIGYLGVWYQDEHSFEWTDGMCFAAGHIHVGKHVSVPDATEATEITLEALIDHIKPMRPTTWISEIMFRVQTADAPNAGTNHPLTVDIYRDGEYLFTGELNFGHINDHERGDSRYYNFILPEGYLFPDESEYTRPTAGIEFSDGIAGNLTCRLQIHGDDKWIKDQVDIYVKEVRPRGPIGWVDDDSHRLLGNWTQDVTLSTYSDEGYEAWDLLY